MDPVNGIDLGSLSKEVDQKQLEEQKDKLRQKIAHIKGQRSESAGSVARLEKDLTKARSSLQKHQERLAKIEAGDWSVLDDKDEKSGQKQPQAEPAPAA